MNSRSFFLPSLTVVLLSVYSAHAEVKKVFDRESIDRHNQIDDLHSIPSGVEMILKLTGRAPSNYYELQCEWESKTDGTFGDFDGKKISGLTFHKQFDQPRNDTFPLKELFAAIHAELKAGRYVLISLPSESGSRVYLIHQEDSDGDFIALSKDGQKTIEIKQIKKIVSDAKGTDILTYSICKREAKKN